MKRAAALFVDYLANALKSAAIGALMAVVVALLRGEGALRLDDAGLYALIGMTCGTCSKAAIEGALSLFGARRFLAYLLNGAVIAAVILAFVYLFLGGFGGMEGWAIVLVFALPEAASVVLVRAGLEEALCLERAFDERREALEAEERK
jgi:hypothetical protein